MFRPQQPQRVKPGPEHGVAFGSIGRLQCLWRILRMPVHSERSAQHVVPSNDSYLGVRV